MMVKSRARTIYSFGAIVLALGALFSACAETRRDLGGDCIKDDDCISDICSSLHCAALPPICGADGGECLNPDGGMSSGDAEAGSSSVDAGVDTGTMKDAGIDSPAAVDAGKDVGVDDAQPDARDAALDSPLNDASLDASLDAPIDAIDAFDAFDAMMGDANLDAADAGG